jgi:flavin reductase (DIM6/NTAB) family NADH-FMN oxidoreductase RutF
VLSDSPWNGRGWRCSRRKEKKVKVELGKTFCLYPMPTVLVGAMVNGKANYITIAHLGIMGMSSLAISMMKGHYTNAGIRENRCFSVNIPSTELVVKTDYCGLVSGREVDKGTLFETFYGSLQRAPMIKECPINMECRLNETIDFPKHDIFIGEIVATYCDEGVMTDGVVDFAKVRPMLFVMNDKSYWNLGERLARAWDVGKALKKG